MSTKLIQLEDDVFVEVKVPSNQVREIAGGFADKVDSTFDAIKPLLVKTCKPVIAAWRELGIEEMAIEEAEVEFGLSFEAEGNLYVTKSKASANVTIRMAFKPQSKE